MQQIEKQQKIEQTYKELTFKKFQILMDEESLYYMPEIFERVILLEYLDDYYRALTKANNNKVKALFEICYEKRKYIKPEFYKVMNDYDMITGLKLKLSEEMQKYEYNDFCCKFNYLYNKVCIPMYVEYV